MPFRKKLKGVTRTHWYVQLILPAFGDTGTLSTWTTDRRRAEAYENLLRWLDANEHWDILEALRPQGPGRSGKLRLPQVYRARRQDRLRELKLRATDPLLSYALKQVEATTSYGNHLRGLRQIKHYAPDGVRLSYITKPAHINGLVAAMLADGYRPRSVANSLWGALSKALQFHYGKSEAFRILREANRPNEDDRRDLHFTPKQIHDIVSACEWEMRMYILILAALGIDKAPCLRIRVSEVDLSRWTVYVPDRKNDERPRTLDLPAVAVYAFKLLCEGKAESERVFSYTSGQVGYRWRKVRDDLGLEELREKDFRHTFAVYYLKGGGNTAALQSRLGHKRGTQSLDYARHEARGTSDMERTAEVMGLKLPQHLRDELPTRKADVRADLEIPAWWFDRSAGPVPIGRYAKRGTAGWSGDERRKTNREWMREYRRRNRPGTGTDGAAE